MSEPKGCPTPGACSCGDKGTDEPGTPGYTLRKFIDKKIALLRSFEIEMGEGCKDEVDDWDGIYDEWESVR